MIEAGEYSELRVPLPTSSTHTDIHVHVHALGGHNDYT